MPEDRNDLADLKRKSVRGGMVTMLSQGITIVTQLISTVVLARLLTPRDYGILAMVTAVTAFAALFRDLGLSSAAIQKKNLTHAQQSNLFWLNVGMGALLTILVASASPLVVWFYGRPELLGVTVALSFSFIIASIGTQHGARLVREMRFSRRAAANIAGALATLVTSVCLALAGFSYWALVWGNLAGATTTTSILLALSAFRPGWLKRGSGVRDMLKFGANVTAFDLVNYFQRNLDNILIGRVWGAGPLGLYSRAYSLLMLPISSIRGPIHAVAFPALSRLQNNTDGFRDYYLKTTWLIALLSMPIAAFFFVASEPIILLVLGPEWSGVSRIFSFLALAAFIQPASGFAGSLLLSLGQGSRYLGCGVFNAVVLSLCFLAGLPYGAVGVAAAYAIGNYVVLYPWMRWAFQKSPVNFRLFVGACAFPAVLSASGGVGSWLAGGLVSSDSPIAKLAANGLGFVLPVVLILAGTRRGRECVRELVKIKGFVNLQSHNGSGNG